MERTFINNNFKYVHVIGLSNGCGWTLDAICKQIVSSYKVANKNPDYVVVWFDREEQTSSAEDIMRNVSNKLTEVGIDEKKICILICDKMTENLILSDEIAVKEFFKLDEYKYKGDGTNGKSEIINLFKKGGGSYKETFHGVNLLKKIRLKNCLENTDTVKNFVDRLPKPCFWIE